MKKLTHAETVFADPVPAGTPEGKSPAKAPEKEPEFSPQRVTALAKRQMNLLVSLETKVLRGEKPGPIHDLRVASRRLQEILDLLYPRPRPAKLRKIRRTLRRARRSLSAVRNTDVLLNQIEQNLGRKRLAHRDVWTTFRDYLQERRDSEMRKASRKLGKLNLAGWYVHAKGVLAVKGTLASAPEPAPEPAPKPISKPAIVARVFGRTAGLGAEPVSARNSPANPAEAAKAPQDSHPPELRALLTESLLQSWEALNNRVVQSQREPSATTIHAVRIAGKRLRYLIEVMQALRVAGSDPALDWLRRLQQDLGEWHDLEVMEQTMIGMVARPKFLRDHLELGLEAEKLVLRNRKVKQDYQDRFFELMEQKTDMEGLANWIHSFTGQRVALGVGVGVAPGQPVETNAG